MTEVENQEAMSPAAIQARKDAAKRLSNEAADAATNAAMMAELASNEDHPVTQEQADNAASEAADKAQVASDVAAAAGLTKPPIDKARIANLKTQVVEWKRLRSIHVDMRDHPEAYGGVDLGGSPLDFEEQSRYVIEYDAAINAAEAEINGN